MKILLIGGFGYIGSTLVDTLLSGGRHDITVLDTLNAASERGLIPDRFYGVLSHEPNHVAFIKGDVCDMQYTWSLIQKHDVIVYLTALTLPNSAKRPEAAILVNRHMAEIVGDCCKKLGKRMIFMSTCSNYGRSELADESSELFPVSIYAISKVDAEKYLLENIPDVTILRCATAYGVGSHMTRWDVIFNGFVRDALSGGAIEVFQPNAHRPICHVEDIAGAIATVIDKDQPGQHVYNVGDNEQNYTKIELANMVAKATNCKIREVKQDDSRDYRVDFGKIRSELGFGVKHTPTSALPQLIQEWRGR